MLVAKNLCLLLLVMVASLCAFGEKHFALPKGPIDNKSTQDIISVVSLDCEMVVTYSSPTDRQIVVKAVKIYLDREPVKEALPGVFSMRRDAMGACGAWQDQFEAQWRNVQQIVKATKIASQ